MADVVKIRVFAEEQTANLGPQAPESCGVARVGGTLAANGKRRVASIPCQFIVRGYQASGKEVPDIRNGRKLDNGNVVELQWESKLENRRTEPKYSWGNVRPVGAIPPAPTLGYKIDESGLLLPGLDGYFQFSHQGQTYYADRTCDGWVEVTYREKTPQGTYVNQLTDRAKAVIGPPDWSANWEHEAGEEPWHYPFVAATDSGLVPGSLAVSSGTRVRWENKGTINHQVIADNNAWQSPVLAPGQTYDRVFSGAGTFGYHCAIHTAETGTIDVG